MGDQHPGGGQAAQGGPDRVLGAVVEHAGRLVEEQDARLAGQGAGNQETLDLAAGQSDPALRDLRVHPHRHGLDVLVEPGRARRVPCLPLAERRIADDVPEDAGRGKLSILQHHAELAAHRLEVERQQVVSVEQHASGNRSFEAEQQPIQRRLAGTGRTHEGHVLPRTNVEGHVLERVAIRRGIAEGHVLEFDPPRQAPQHRSAADALGLRLDDRHDAFEQGQHGDRGRPGGGQPDHAPHELPEGGMEREEIGQCELGRRPAFPVFGHRGPAFEQRVPDQRQQRELGERPEQRVEGVLAGRPHARGQMRALLFGVQLRPAREGAALGVRLPELGQPGDHLEDQPADRPLGHEFGPLMVDLARGEPPAPRDQHQHRDPRPQRELPAVVEQQRIAEDREQAAHQAGAGRPGQDLADDAHAVRPIRQIAGEIAPEEGRRQREKLAPHRGLEGLVDPGLDPQHAECGDDRDGGGRERAKRQRRQRGGPHRNVHPGDDLGQQLSGHDRGQQSDEGAQGPHEGHARDVPAPAAQGLEERRQATVHAAGERRVEHHTLRVERFGPLPVHRGRLAGDGVDHPVGATAAVDDRHRPRPLRMGDDPQEGRSVPPLPSGGQQDPAGADARGRHERVHRLERVGGVVDGRRIDELHAGRVGEDGGGRLQRAPVSVCRLTAERGDDQEAGQLPEHRLLGLDTLTPVLGEPDQVLLARLHPIVRGASQDLDVVPIQRGPQPPGDDGARRVDRRDARLLGEGEPDVLGQRE